MLLKYFSWFCPCTRAKLIVFLTGIHIWVDFPRIESVSYTHLDVYKRQVPEAIKVNKQIDTINSESLTLSSTLCLLLSSLTVQELSHRANNTSGVTPAGLSPLTGVHLYRASCQPHRHGDLRIPIVIWVKRCLTRYNWRGPYRTKTSHTEHRVHFKTTIRDWPGLRHGLRITCLTCMLLVVKRYLFIQGL